jgi:uncharacterized membrane protein YvbJ
LNFCENCGEKLNGSGTFCMNCGWKLSEVDLQSTEDSHEPQPNGPQNEAENTSMSDVPEVLAG